VAAVGDIMNVTLVPFGNSRFNTLGKLQCQHGEDECKADSWEQCAISNYPDFSDHWPFYLCVEAASKKCGEGAGTCVLEKMEGCATSAGLDYSKLSACTGNKAEANRLQHTFSDLTPSEHTYVPWVVVDGKVSQNSDKLIKQVCKAYKGTKPAACKKAEADEVAEATEATVSAATCSAAW